jgi:serine protease
LIGGVWRYTNYTFYATGPPAILSPAPGSVLALNQAFTWSPGTGSTMSELQLGTTGPGSSNIYDSGPTTATSATVPSVPANSVTVFARLRSFIGGSWQNVDYTYTEPPPPVKAALINPISGAVLGSSATFTWTAGTDVTLYALWLGTTGPGSFDLYNSGHTTSITTGVLTLPTNGVRIYAQLWSFIGGNWMYTQYTFFEAGPPAILSPTPGSVLGLSQTFAWSPGTGSTMSELQLGTTGPGSSNIFDSGPTTATSAFVPLVPANSATLFARLMSFIGGSWQSVDYTYTESAPPVKAALISPTPGTVLGPSATFTWTPGTGVTIYDLALGTTGFGSSDIYTTGHTTAHSTGAIPLPTNGVTVYAQLYSYVGGSWLYSQYTFTEQ